MTHDEIYLKFIAETIASLLSERDPVLWGELFDQASDAYRQAVLDGKIERV